MIHLRVRSEYSFQRAIGCLGDLTSLADGSAMALTDTGGVWGHVPWAKACKAAKIKPLFGVEILVVENARDRTKQHGVYMVFLARTNAGLGELYHLVTLANSTICYYYVPRIDYADVNSVSDEIIVLTGVGADLARLRKRELVCLEMTPANPLWNHYAIQQKGWPMVVTADNYFPRAWDRRLYDAIIWQPHSRHHRVAPMHLLSEAELHVAIPAAPQRAFDLTETLAEMCDADLPTAVMIRTRDAKSLYTRCVAGAKLLKISLAKGMYQERLKRELDLIEVKKFADYFHVIADMVSWARKTMVVGPGRGSAAGSLVCYLLRITDVDPLKHGLMFERFVDITRADLPDIDLDFPDVRRDEVMAYLSKTYGEDRVGRLGTVNRYAPKSALDDIARQLLIPAGELVDLKGAVVDRSSGDARAQFCVKDTLALDVGKAMLIKYPSLSLAGDLEGMVRHHGMHAAGVVVTEKPLMNYCAVDTSGCLQLDKYDAETLNLLKIDVLGLRTLAVIEFCLRAIGKEYEWLRNYTLEDSEAFRLLNTQQFGGIFQYEGYALQSLTKQMQIECFNDIVAITALARPGPLHCGAATQFIKRRLGQEVLEPLHPLVQSLTEDTLGVVIYQEQVMAISRFIGDLSWEDVSQLRKAMSKSLGEEFFNTYWEKFKIGAIGKHHLTEDVAVGVWKKMCTFGSWAFNKSHAVSYGLISYWCAVLKAHWPLQYAVACLNHPRSEDQAIKLLREVVLRGYQVISVDPQRSGLQWQIVDQQTLLGPLTNVKGIGEAKAKIVIQRRGNGQRSLFSIADKLLGAEMTTPYDNLFEAKERFGDVYAHPRKYNVKGKVFYIKDIHENGSYTFIGKLVDKNLRDMNEYGNVVKRGGVLVEDHSQFLNLTFEDDTDSIISTIGRFDYPVIGKSIVETGKIGDWYLCTGNIRNDWRKVYLKFIRKLDDVQSKNNEFVG